MVYAHVFPTTSVYFYSDVGYTEEKVSVKGILHTKKDITFSLPSKEKYLV